MHPNFENRILDSLEEKKALADCELRQVIAALEVRLGGLLASLESLGSANGVQIPATFADSISAALTAIRGLDVSSAGDLELLKFSQAQLAATCSLLNSLLALQSANMNLEFLRSEMARIAGKDSGDDRTGSNTS